MVRARTSRKALQAKRESKSVDFKISFDTDRNSDWCELIKDFVSMANSGGGTILIGVANDGSCSGDPAGLKVLDLDPAVITDKVARYTGAQFDGFSVVRGQRDGNSVAVVAVQAAQNPLIFEKPGTYPVEGGKQRTAFGAGTLYVRHGAKSEPAKSEDIARIIEKQIQRVRKEWLAGVRKVVTAPTGSAVSVLPPNVTPSGRPDATAIRLTTDPNAPQYRLVDPDITHPWRQKELIAEVNKSLPPERRINQFDVLSIRHLYNIDDDPRYVHKSRFATPQYSPSFASWLLESFATDPSFFEKSRDEYKRRRATK
jgi:hypothetical protein